VNIILERKTAEDLVILISSALETGQYDKYHNVAAEFQQIVDSFDHNQSRYTLQVQLIERLPITPDIVLNALVNAFLSIWDEEEDDCDISNAIWHHLKTQYEFDTEEHDLDRCTSLEAIQYALRNCGADQ